MRIRTLLIAGVVLSTIAGPTRTFAQTATYSACYVPDVGALYLIKEPGLPSQCLASSHVEVTLSAGAVADGSVTTADLADGAVTIIKLAFDPATQAELDALVAELQGVGTLNTSTNPVDWTKLKGVPADFADGTDANNTYDVLAGGGLELSGSQFGLLQSCADGQVLKWLSGSGTWACADDTSGASGGDITEVLAGVGLTGGGTSGSVTLSAALTASGGDAGTATTVARGDHVHDALYNNYTDAQAVAAVSSAGVDWAWLVNVPAGFADGTDDNTTYTAGAGLTLGATTFAVDFGGPGTAGTAARSDHTHIVAGGSNSVGVGPNALSANTGYNNTAIGRDALTGPSGSTNIAVGALALQNTTTGGANTAVGVTALNANQGGSANTALGYGTIGGNTSGASNVAVGSQALAAGTSGSYNTAIGASTMTSAAGSNNIAIGYAAGSSLGTGSRNIYIGHYGASAESGKIRIGLSSDQDSTFIAGIFGVNVSGPAVYVNSSGQLGINTSSARYKTDIEDLGAVSRRVMELRPVRFRYRPEYDDGSGQLHYGLIAEEVLQTFPDLVFNDAEGRPETVRYNVLPVLLLNELQRQERELRSQQQELSELRDLVAAQAAALEALRARVERLEP